MAAVASRVEARITGDVSGQIAVGDHIMQNNVSHGGVVYVAAPGETPTPRARPLPVALPGRRGPEPVGREREVQAALDALAASTPIEFVGPPGIGKTTVLKYVAHGAPEGTAVDGVVYHDAHGEAVEDTLQFLYSSFYETSVPFKPTEAQLQHAMRDIRALVVLDELDVDRSGVAQILDSLPSASSVLGSARRSLWGGGSRSVQLRGLRGDAALQLLTQELGRDLSERERQVAAVIADAVDGQPLQLLRAAALVSVLGYELAELADDLARGSAPEELGRLLLGSLGDEERLILEVLAALGGATLPADQLAELTGVGDAGPILESLMRLGLVQAHSPRYSTAGIVEPLADGLDPGSADQAAGAHMVRWIEARRDDPEAVVREVQAILAVLRSAARDGEWADVLRLGRAAEGPLLLTSRWGAWREVLEHELLAARRLGDRAAEGWAQHQLGSRSLCLGERSAAIAGLRSAIRIRDELGDRDGADASRHNLDLLLGGGHRPPGAQPRPGPLPLAPLAPLAPAAPGWLPTLVLPLVLLLLGSGVVTGIVLWPTDPVRTGPGASTAGSVQPSDLVFGNQEVGTASRARTATVSNTGTTDVMVRDVTMGGSSPGSFRIERDGCSGVALGPGRSCPVSVVFAPALAASHQATLTVRARGLDLGPVTLRGAGVPGSATGGLRVQPATIDFGTVAPSSRSTQTVRILNVGPGQLQLGGMTISGTDRAAFSVSRTRCPTTVAPGTECSVDVTFSPGTAPTYVAALSVRTADGDTQGSVLSGRATIIDPDPRPPTTIDLQVPTSQVMPYGSVVDLAAKATASPSGTPALVAFGMPSGVDFVDNGNGTGTFRGTVLAAPGTASIVVAATIAGVASEREPFTLTIVPADVSLRWEQPTLEVAPGATVFAKAILTQVGGTRGDPTVASVRFDVVPCASFSPDPVAVDPSGQATGTIDDLPLGINTVRPSLVSSQYYRVVSSEPLSVVVVPDVAALTGYLLSSTLVVPETATCPFAGA